MTATVSIPFLSGLSLHRDGPGNTVDRVYRTVSIPFLSGLSLHPPEDACRQRSDRGREFQSPSYRGCLCIRRELDVKVLLVLSFNPLPIGAVSASRQTGASNVCRLPVVSIPFLSGLSLHRNGCPVQ